MVFFYVYIFLRLQIYQAVGVFAGNLPAVSEHCDEIYLLFFKQIEL